MSKFSKLFSLLLATSYGTSFAVVCTGEWTGAGTPDDNWSVPANWSNNCSPQADGDSASFGTAGPTPLINLDIPVTVTDLTFNNPSQDFTITPVGPGTMTLQSFNGVNPTINILGGTQTFNQPITTVAGDTLFLTVDSVLNTNGQIGAFPEGDLVVNGTGVINNADALLGANFTQNGGIINNFGLISGFNTTNLNGGVFNNFGSLTPVSELFINGGILTLIKPGGTLTPMGITINSGSLINGTEIVDLINLTVNGGLFINETGNFFLEILDAATINGGTVINQNGSASFIVGGALTINGGVFQNDGVVIAPSATVNGSGIVTGTGTFDTAFVNNGLVIPGESPGNLSFTEYTQTPAGNLKINILNSSTFGSITSATSANLAGTLTVAPYPGFAGITPGTPLTIVSAGTQVTGTFSNIVDLFSSSVRAEVFYFPTSVVLELFPVLSSFVSFKEVTFSTINQINLLLVNHMDRMVDPCYCPEYKYQFYVDPLGSTGRVHGRSGLSGYRFDTVGVLAGFDTFFSDGGIGVAFDYERVYAKGKNGFGNFGSNKYHFSGYGTYLLDPCLKLDAIIGGGWENNRLRRSTGFFGDEFTFGTPDGYSFDAFLGAEYLLNACQFNIIPLAGLQYIYYNIDRFHETGVFGFNNEYNHQHYDSLRSLLGLKVNRPFYAGCFEIVPQINVAWQYDFLDRRKTFFASNTDFILPADPILVPTSGRNIVLAGADIAVMYERYTVDFSYEYEGSNRYNNQFFYVELAAAF